MTILFDLDGTILDTAPDFTVAINRLLVEENQPALSVDAVRSHVSNGSKAAVKHAFNIDESHEKFDSFLERFITYYADTLEKSASTFFPGMAKLLEDIEALGVTWGIVTNKPGFLTEPLLKTFKLDTRAQCVVSGDTTPHPKPHPAPMFKACDILSESPENCLYVGDAERDIIAGNEAGMTTIAALFGYIPSREEAMQWEANFFVEHSSDILPKVEQWQRR